MKRIFFTILVFILAFRLAHASHWVTISAGYWNSSAVWAGGVVPPLSSSDTFSIKHPVAFYNNLFFNAGAYLKIDSAGGLCGHNNVTIRTGAKFIKYGIFEIDSLFIPGGQVNMLATGAVTLTCYGILSNGGSLTISGCPLIVGPWFNCRTPEFQFTGISEKESVAMSLSLYPQPAKDIVNISFSNCQEKNINVVIIDITGKIIERKDLTVENGKTQLQLNSLQEGIYFMQIRNSLNQITTKKLVVAR